MNAFTPGPCHLLVIRPFPQSWAACGADGDKSLASYLPFVDCPSCREWAAVRPAVLVGAA